MIISKDENSEWCICLEDNNSIMLYNKGSQMMPPLFVTEEEAKVLREKKATQMESLECEYKFLVKNENWKENISATESYKQLYLTKDINKWQSRIRIVNDEKAFLTIKGPRVGIANIEVEYPLDIKEAFNLWNIHEGVRLSKDRNIFIVGDEKWEIDVFTDNELKGLQLVEIELPNQDSKIKFIPDWVGQDVTEDPDFRNDSLANYVYEKKNALTEKDIFVKLHSYLSKKGNKI